LALLSGPSTASRLLLCLSGTLLFGLWQLIYSIQFPECCTAQVRSTVCSKAVLCSLPFAGHTFGFVRVPGRHPSGSNRYIGHHNLLSMIGKRGRGSSTEHSLQLTRNGASFRRLGTRLVLQLTSTVPGHAPTKPAAAAIASARLMAISLLISSLVSLG